MPVVTAPPTTRSREPEDEEATAAEEGAGRFGAATGPARPRRSDRRDARRACGARDSAACTSTAARSTLEDVDVATLKDRGTLQVIVDRVKVEGDLRARLTDSIETAYTEGGGAAFAMQLAPPTAGQPDRHATVQRAVRVPRVQHPVRAAATAAVLVQQPVRRVPALPRLRQRHRARHGSGRARSIEVDHAERHRALEQAALPRAARGAEARGEAARPAARRAVVAADRRREAVRHRRRRRRATKGSRVSSAGSNARSTRSTSACSSAATAAT